MITLNIFKKKYIQNKAYILGRGKMVRCTEKEKFNWKAEVSMKDSLYKEIFMEMENLHYP